MKIIAMIPARLGSKRVKSKNLRLINGKALIEYVLETVIKTNIFDSIWVNSESEIFSEIAQKYGVGFYKRPEELATDTSTNDEFAYDFINHTECDILVQILPTSPFITLEDITSFVEKMVDEQLDTLISVEHKQIACIMNNVPLNFKPLEKNPPSQTMEPILAYATALMGWRSESYKHNIENYGVAYHGGKGKTGYFELSGLSTIDIDTEADFNMAEAVVYGKDYVFKSKPEYYSAKCGLRSEVNVPEILSKDGVQINDLFDVNKEVVKIDEILESMPKDKSWSKRLIDTENNSVTIISQMPGEGNRRHFHPDWNEWWYILEGEWRWEIEGYTKKVVKGDVVFISKNRNHQITAAGNSRAIRMAVSRADVEHIYVQDE